MEYLNAFLCGGILCAIGQSDNRFTPMQLGVYAATLANEGTRLKATFLNRVVSADYQSLLDESEPTVVSTLDIGEDCIRAYKDGMVMVTTVYGGTAYRELRNYPITVAGKTGTAQEVYGASDNGAFVCYAPADDPQIAIAVYIEKGGHGNAVVSAATAIMDAYFDNDEEATDVNTYENRLA